MSSKPLPSFTRRTAAQILFAALVALLLPACQSFNSPPDGPLASVNIQNQTVPAIAEAVQQVFVEHYFEGGASGPNTLVYTRPGSAMNNIAYGSFMNENTTVRVEVTITPRPGNLMQVGCTAQIVTDAQDAFFAEPHSVHKFQKEPYQKLLDEVQARLK